MINNNTPIGSIILNPITTVKYELVGIEYCDIFRDYLFYLKPLKPFFNNEKNTFSITLKSIEKLNYRLINTL